MAGAGSDGSHPLAVEVKPARLELLKVKSAAEQELGSRTARLASRLTVPSPRGPTALDVKAP